MERGWKNSDAKKRGRKLTKTGERAGSDKLRRRRRIVQELQHRDFPRMVAGPSNEGRRPDAKGNQRRKQNVQVWKAGGPQRQRN